MAAADTANVVADRQQQIDGAIEITLGKGGDGLLQRQGQMGRDIPVGSCLLADVIAKRALLLFEHCFVAQTGGDQGDMQIVE